jgi:co-chaperonin GroES (HSP10)
MADTPDERPRPTPHARPTRPTPRPRVAGSRRDRDEVAPVSRPVAPAAASSRRAATSPATPSSGRRISALALTLVLLCVAAAAGLSVLLWLRSRTTHVDPSIFSAASSGIQALYAYDYKDSEGSVQGKLDVLTGDLRDEYEQDLTQGGIIETYEQVSATTRYEVLDVGLQQVNEAQDTATLVVFGQYVVESVNSGSQPAPEGSECQVTPGGAQSCTQTVRVTVVDVDGDWKISDLTLLTTS